jgi:hypothetical protein
MIKFQVGDRVRCLSDSLNEHIVGDEYVLTEYFGGRIWKTNIGWTLCEHEMEKIMEFKTGELVEVRDEGEDWESEERQYVGFLDGLHFARMNKGQKAVAHGWDECRKLQDTVKLTTEDGKEITISRQSLEELKKL